MSGVPNRVTIKARHMLDTQRRASMVASVVKNSQFHLRTPATRIRLGSRALRCVRHASTSSAPSKASRTIRNIVFISSATLLAAYYLDSRSALHRYIVPPLLRTIFDAETSHRIAVNVLASGLAPRDMRKDDERLETDLWGLKLTSPVSLAAGFDKNVEAIDGQRTSPSSIHDLTKLPNTSCMS
jgi:hypothetical protein